MTKTTTMPFMKITNTVELYDGFYAIEILNQPEESYEYYLYKHQYPLTFTFGSTLEGFDCNPFMYEYVFELLSGDSDDEDILSFYLEG